MANDSELKIKATLDISQAQRKFKELDEASKTAAQDIQSELSGSVKKSTDETHKLAEAMKDAGEKSRMSAEQIGSMVTAMSGLALNLASTVARNQGHDDAADYMSGIGGGVLAGATAGMAAGPWGAVIGGAAGGLMGGLGTWFQHDTRDKEAAEAEAEAARKQAEAMRALMEANGDLVEKFDELRKKSQDSAKFFEMLGDETVDTGEKEKALADRIAKFREENEALRATLADPAVLKDAKQFREVFGDFSRNQAELDRMTAYGIKEPAKEKPEESATATDDEVAADRRATIDTDSLQRLGISLGGGNDYAREQLSTAKASLEELKRLNEKDFAGGIATWQ